MGATWLCRSDAGLKRTCAAAHAFARTYTPADGALLAVVDRAMDTRLRPRHRLRAAAPVHALWQPCYWPWRSSRWVICTTCGECRLARRACAADPRSGPSTASPSACAGQPCPTPAPAFPYQLRAPGRSGGLPRALSHPRRGRRRPVGRDASVHTISEAHLLALIGHMLDAFSFTLA